MKIKAVLSDLDKTLIEDSQVPGKVIEVVRDFLQISNQQAMHIVTDFYDIQTTKAHYLNGYTKVGAWKRVLSKNNISFTPHTIYEMNHLFWTTAASFARPYPHVLETLAYIKSQHLLFAVVSGGDYMTRYQHIKQTGILPFVDVLVTTEQIGLIKHEKNLYEVAAKELGVEYQECLAIGDNEIADIVLPKKDGFITVKVDRLQRTTSADFRVRTFADIREVLKNSLLTQQLPQ